MKRKRVSTSDDDSDASEDSESRESRGSKITRSAKSGNKWTQNDLDAFNITIREETEDEFFDLRGSQLPASTVDPTILDNLDMPGPQTQISNSTRKFFQYFGIISHGIESAESAVDDFSFHLFGSVLGYNSLATLGIIRRRMKLTLAMCGSKTKVKPNITILREDNKIILVDENKV